jgi:hypothetical protein
MSNPYNLTPDQILPFLPYEKKLHSQHGESGIIELLTDNIIDTNKIFLEIGWGNGLGNMTIDLLEKNWSGTGVDLFDEPHPDAKITDKFTYIKLKIEPGNVYEALKNIPRDFDFFSLDIDSYDFEISKTLLELEYRPKVCCLEFNPRFGPDIEASFPYKVQPKKKLYRKYGIYGSSIKKYIKLWESYGYRFFTYDSSLTNLFFYDPMKLNDMSSYVTYKLENFPIKEDKNLEIIKEHGMWIEELDIIYKGYEK